MNLSHTQHSSAAARETVMKGKTSRTLHRGPVLVLRGCVALGTLGRCGVKVETTRYLSGEWQCGSPWGRAGR